MLLDWTRHLKNDEEKKSFEAALRNSHLLNRLRDLLSEREKALTSKELSTQIYDSPSWPYLQAHINGKKEELLYLHKLLNF
jgi:hypothetical protein